MTDTDETLYQETIQTFLLLYRYLRRYGRQLQNEGMSGRKIATLRYLVEAGPLTIGQLSAYLCISDSSTSTMIAWLERKGYLTRTRSKQDNRVVLVDLTPTGQELVQKTTLGGIPLLREALRTLPLEQLSLVHDALATIVDVLEIKDDR
jgi:DNA-binding MarR family transcriptional regulator